jgi:hypothetical protein
MTVNNYSILVKLHMRWLGPFQLVYINEVSATKITTLQGQLVKGLNHGSMLKVYHGPQGSTIG